jgi:hypothetical protein
MLTAILIAQILGRSLDLVWTVWQKAEYSVDPVVACAVVEYESSFDPDSWCYERDKRGKIIGTSWGLYRLFDKYHYQFRYDLGLHCWYGAAYLAWCIWMERGDVRRGLSRYCNGDGGWPKYADAVMAVVRELRGNPLVRR